MQVVHNTNGQYYRKHLGRDVALKALNGHSAASCETILRVNDGYCFASPRDFDGTSNITKR